MPRFNTHATFNISRLRSSFEACKSWSYTRTLRPDFRKRGLCASSGAVEAGYKVAITTRLK
jgi:hypothetical protein